MASHAHSLIYLRSFTHLLAIISCFISSSLSREAIRVDTAPTPVSTACGSVIAKLEHYSDDGPTDFIPAVEAYECLISVPINVDVALRFIEYYNTTLQFHSTFSFLKTPPAEYQQPPVDVDLRFRQLEHDLLAGVYPNQYDFEVALQTIVHDLHDAHVTLDADVLSAFKFGNPELYIDSHVINSRQEGWIPSPIKLINGEDAISFMSRFAAINSFGKIEPHAEWNDMMYNAVQDITGLQNTFGWQVPFYPGDELIFTLQNTTIIPSRWDAIYQNWFKTGPLSTGGDFYNYFVLGQLPSSAPDVELRYPVDDTSSAPLQSWTDIAPAFPPADVVQADLSIDGAGSLTGYFLKDGLTAVLSIPSFNHFGTEIDKFTGIVSEFISEASNRRIRRVVIDLQQNLGGTPLLAFDTFWRFFPNIEPYAGSRRRSHRHANVLGTALTNFWINLRKDDPIYDYDTYHDVLAGDEWVIADRLNAQTHQLFRDWQEYQGPVHVNNDEYSLVERYNLTDQVFDESAFDYYTTTEYSSGFEPPFKAEDIILLTDASCSSTCALFVEMMTQIAGVRTVVLGGIPKSGPMQAVGGSRGASAYSAEILNADIDFAGQLNETARSLLPPNADGVGMYIPMAAFNLRDQIREGDTVPLQLRYDAADCRMFFTLDNAYNMTRLWLDAADAMWKDQTRCVLGSVGYTKRFNVTETKPPPERPSPPQQPIKSPSLRNVLTTTAVHARLSDGLPGDKFVHCPEGKSGKTGGGCRPARCDDAKSTIIHVEYLYCDQNSPGDCGSGLGQCRPLSKVNTNSKSIRSRTHSDGMGDCVPKLDQNFPGCPNYKRV